MRLDGVRVSIRSAFDVARARASTCAGTHDGNSGQFSSKCEMRAFVPRAGTRERARVGDADDARRGRDASRKRVVVDRARDGRANARVDDERCANVDGGDRSASGRSGDDSTTRRRRDGVRVFRRARARWEERGRSARGRVDDGVARGARGWWWRRRGRRGGRRAESREAESKESRTSGGRRRRR